MRGTPTYLKRFWKDRSGAGTVEVVIILAAFGAVLVSGMIIEKGSIAHGIALICS